MYFARDTHKLRECHTERANRSRVVVVVVVALVPPMQLPQRLWSSRNKNESAMKSSVLLFLVVFHVVSAARILSIFHTPSKSHQLLGQQLLLELLASGHHVTMISPFPVHLNASANFRHIHLHGVETYYDCKSNQKSTFVLPHTHMSFPPTIINQTIIHHYNCQLYLF